MHNWYLEMKSPYYGAPGGPGWPQEGVNWHEAVQTCQMLNQDGKSIGSEPQNIWRLPTVDEAVRSMALQEKTVVAYGMMKMRKTVMKKDQIRSFPFGTFISSDILVDCN